MRTFDGILDIALSFSESSVQDVELVTKILKKKMNVYNYKYWLDRQVGYRIENLSHRIYSNIPCIMFCTADWFYRPATVLEWGFLKDNSERKLIFDYCGEFAARSSSTGVSNFSYGRFGQRGELDTISVSEFVEEIFPSLVLKNLP